MRTQNILLISAAALMLLSCVKEPHEQLGGGFGDGTATRITISLKSDKQPGAAPALSPAGALRAWSPSGIAAMGTLPASRALTTEQEQLISNLHILIFDAGGAIVVNEHFENLNITEVGSVPLETLPGADMQIWAVANGDVNDDTGYKLDDHLKTVTTLDELKALMVNVKGNGLNRADRLTMVGNTTVTITKPHKTAIPIQMHFLSAKVTLTIKNNIPEGQAITITGWDMVNIPKKTYLRERTDPNEDAVTSSDYITTNGKYEFDIKGDVTGTWSQEFYLFENRRGGRVPRTDPSGDTYPDMGIDDNDQRGKAYYAPVGATYMLIYGTYTKEGRMNNVVYKIFFGENEINDYNIHRGKHYKYNVTINGLNNINIDSNVEWGSASFSVATSDNLMMDAHPDFRVLRIGGTAVDIATPAYATVEVLESNGTSPCTWLALSPLNLYRHGIKQATGDHQQFGVAEGAGSYVRSKYTAAPTAESTLADATFAMTRKLTRIPFNQPAVYTYQNVIVYADTYDGTADRTATVCVTYYRGADGTQEAGKLTYDITQSGAIRISDDLYMERYEESAMLLHPGLASGFQNTTTMQWGYNTATLYAEDDRFSNGGYLTANAVYNNVGARSGMTPPQWTANAYTDYRDKFPRSGTKVVEPSSLPVSDDVYFYPEQNASTPLTAYFHPIFNSSAARYCHEKNRDTDGDGVISAAETVWYLPSFADMWYISKNMPAGTTLSGTYWTATEESNTNSWAYTFPATGPASTAKGTSARVRCVRGNGVVLPDAKMESTEADKTKINLAATAGAAGAFNITDATGLPWIVSVSEDATSWLKIATSANGTGAAATATGNGNKTLYVSASANPSIDAGRTGALTYARVGAPQHNIVVNQSKCTVLIPPAMTGWAGSNIYWDPSVVNDDGSKGRLTFADVTDNTKSSAHGVLFKWGSLVALSPLDKYEPSSTVLFSANGKMDYAYKDIPIVLSYASNSLQERSTLMEHHSPAENLGDICKYIADKGWAPDAKTKKKKWRMPTLAEVLEIPTTLPKAVSAPIGTLSANGLGNNSDNVTLGNDLIMPRTCIRSGAYGPIYLWSGRVEYLYRLPSATGYQNHLDTGALMGTRVIQSRYGTSACEWELPRPRWGDAPWQNIDFSVTSARWDDEAQSIRCVSY